MSIKFEYRYIESAKDRAYIKMKTREIKMLLPKLPGSRVPGEDYFTIGTILLEMKSRITPKLLFYAWIDTEVGMSKDVAAKYMKIVRVFGEKYNTTKHVPYTTLHELTYPSYPPSILENIESGGYVPSLARIQEIREEYIMSRRMTIQDIYAQLNAFATPTPDTKPAENYVVQKDTTQEIDALREDVKQLAEQCRKAEQERDMLIESIRKLIDHESRSIVKR